MTQERSIEPGELIRAISQELLKSGLKIQSAELELKVVVHRDQGDLKIQVLDSTSEAHWQNFHTLRVKVSQDSDTPPGGRVSSPQSNFGLGGFTDSSPDVQTGDSGDGVEQDPDTPPGYPGDPPGGSGNSGGTAKTNKAKNTDQDGDDKPGGSGKKPRRPKPQDTGDKPGGSGPKA